MSFELNNIHKKFNNLYVLKNLNMKFNRSKIISILGPSGCGKTTILNIISSMISPDSGEVIGFKNHNISYLFQEPRLLKWKTVYKNIEFVLNDKVIEKSKSKIIDKYLDLVDLKKYKNFYPKQLSGGMKQRVAIARAFAYPSDILLMDEPFKSLDFQLKFSLINSFIKLWQINKPTVVFVTHDIHSALMLGDEIYLLSQKPTTIKHKIINNVPINERNLQNKELLHLEKKLYKYYSYDANYKKIKK